MTAASPSPDHALAESLLQGNAGAALESDGLTWEALLAGVAYALTLHYAQLVVFVILRPRLARIYRPRTYLLPRQVCTQKPPDGSFAWLRPVWSIPDDQIIEKCGLDAFLFLRYIRMMLRIFLPIALVAIPILVPINRLSGKPSRTTSLKGLSISNVEPRYTATRLWAHCAVGTFVVGWVCYVLHDETLRYVVMRQRYLRGHGKPPQVSANTILVGNIPKTLLTNEKLKEVFDVFPGGVKAVHINTDVRELSSRMSARESLVEQLEVAETRLIRQCASRSAEKHKPVEGRTPSSERRPSQALSLPSAAGDRDTRAAWERYTRPQDREAVRLPLIRRRWFPSITLLGKKVDRICHLREELDKVGKEIELLQANAEACPPTSSAFIQFHQRIAAHLASQSVIIGMPHRMTPRMLDVDPQDVIWVNLALGGRQRWVRACVGLTASAAVIVLYAVPIALTSLLANLDALAESVDWLAWLEEWPDVTKSLVQGVLPPALLQLLLLLVPTIYRTLVYLQGAPTGTAREMGVQNWHFVFLFVQVFLVVSISGGLITFLSGAADNPKSVPAELARSLPRAANYFVSYVLVKALTGSAGSLLQPCTLLVHSISPILDVSPRQIWRRQAKLATVEWARLLPPLTNIAVIGIAFSAIAPLVLAFVSFAFALHWVVHRYNVIYVYQYDFESGGRFFVAAINQLFAGLYVMEVCLVGIFVLATGPSDGTTCIPQAVAMMAVMALTVAFQSFLNRTYRVLMSYLPVSAEDEAPFAQHSKPERQKTSICNQNRNGPSTDKIEKRPESHVLGVEYGRVAAVFARKTLPTDSGGFDPALNSHGEEDADITMRLGARMLAPTVWIPKDKLGVSRGEIDAAVLAVPNLEVSDDGALIDDGGNVSIEACPPEQGSMIGLKIEPRSDGEHVA